MSIIDALGIEASVGDEVVFGQAGKGAQELLKGEILKVNGKTVSIQYAYSISLHAGYDDKGSIYKDLYVTTTTTRKNKCFVITSYAN